MIEKILILITNFLYNNLKNIVELLFAKKYLIYICQIKYRIKL